MIDERAPRYLRFARALALTGALAVGGCEQTNDSCDVDCCFGIGDAGNDSGVVETRPTCDPGHHCCSIIGPLAPPDLPA